MLRAPEAGQMEVPSSLYRRAARAAGLGCVLGCVGAALSAFSDFGAHWLWLATWGDRGALLVRLLGLQVPFGAAFGAGLGAAFGASEQLIEDAAARAVSDRSRARAIDALRALRLTALSSPALLWVGISLFTGGKMSRLPAKHLLEAIACVGLLAGMIALAYAAHRLHSRAAVHSGARARLAVAAAATAFALDKLNQWALPNLYDYLHAALTAAAFALYLGAAWLLLEAQLGARARNALTLGFVPALSLLGLCVSSTVARLDQNQNVRVALLHSNMPHSRALLQAVAPMLLEPAQRRATEQARQKAQRARSERAHSQRSNAGPVLDDAHILLITVDALRPDHLGTYGYKRPTSPELDRFAQQSVVFERVYAPAPHSSYSLCSLMTSEYLHETLDLGQPLPSQTVASVLGQAGYHTAGFYSEGIFHTAAERVAAYERNAFDFALHDQVTYTAEQLTDRVLQEVDRTAARGEPNSFFWVHYFDVHEPYLSTHFGAGDMDRYDSEILHVDGQIARLIREVRRKLKRNVIVAISADHGEEFYDHGGVYHGSTLYEEQVRVPLILNAPGLPQRRVAATAKTLDLAPTLLAMVGIGAPSSMRGDDLRALALGQVNELGPAFSAVIHKKMVVRWPYKLIADLRFGLFELYDLEHDPKERENLADRQPDVRASLRAEVYGWLDSLGPDAANGEGPAAVALEWGRLGDRRAVEPLCNLLSDTGGSTENRAEAARILGRLADEHATQSLVRAMTVADNPRVAAEAAIALGRMFDPRARELLRRLISSEDPQLRTRAAVSLGRLRDTHAVPALIEALWVGQDDYERQEAARWLGRLRDTRALDALIQVLPEMRTRYLVPVALGMIGDARAYQPLIDVLTWDRHSNVRDATVQGLGLLGDPRAIPLLTRLAAEEASLKLASESLVRLGALRALAIGGTDVAESEVGARDFGPCHAGPIRHDWDYEHRTYCQTRGAAASLSLQVPQAVTDARHGTVVALSIRRTDSARPARLTVVIGTRTLDPIEVDGSWAEYRFTLAPGDLQQGRIAAHLASSSPEARFAVDHLLLLPRNSELVAERADQPSRL
jgi:arylsulfatase A-like enzyme